MEGALHWKCRSLAGLVLFDAMGATPQFLRSRDFQICSRDDYVSDDRGRWPGPRSQARVHGHVNRQARPGERTNRVICRYSPNRQSAA